MGNEEGPSPPRSDSFQRVFVSFDALRSSLTPISLMFDGSLFRDVKSLASHLQHAKKRLTIDRPDFQGAINEINQLEASFNSTVGQWESKLTSEIQRLKTTIEKEPSKAMGATKQIAKYQAELTKGRGSTRSMPSKITQARNQLIAASGKPSEEALGTGHPATVEEINRLSNRKQKLPHVYTACAEQIRRKVEKGTDKSLADFARSMFQRFSTSVAELESTAQIHRGVVYYLHEPDGNAASGADLTNATTRQKAQFVEIVDLNDEGTAYVARSVFPEVESTFEIAFEQFDAQTISVFQPLDDKQIMVNLLLAKFKGEDFKPNFHRYHKLREKAAELNREERFNPVQEAIHTYLTERILKFVGMESESLSREDEIRLVGEIDRMLQT